MTHDDVFLQAIIENPDEDTLRLRYADYLAGHGQSDRAEFIRIQCELMRMPMTDPRQGNLESRAWGMREDCEGRWLGQCGLPMTWEDALRLFRRRLGETMAWWHRRGTAPQPRGNLRTPALRPPPLCWEQTPGSPCRTMAQRRAIVHGLAARRAWLLSEAAEPRPEPPAGVTAGRLLLFDPSWTLFDGAAAAESEGLIDVCNVPGWDTWVTFVEEQKRQEDGSFGSYLVSWVPPPLLGPVDDAIAVNPEQCLRWAADVDVAFTRRLRAAGLLG